jgi:hypothetical protein
MAVGPQISRRTVDAHFQHTQLRIILEASDPFPKRAIRRWFRRYKLPKTSTGFVITLGGDLRLTGLFVPCAKIIRPHQKKQIMGHSVVKRPRCTCIAVVFVILIIDDDDDDNHGCLRVPSESSDEYLCDCHPSVNYR